MYASVLGQNPAGERCGGSRIAFIYFIQQGDEAGVRRRAFGDALRVSDEGGDGIGGEGGAGF